MENNLITTKGGLRVRVSEKQVPLSSALDSIYASIDTRKGAVFSSGFDYPGRHSRWDLGFVDPALEFVVRGNSFRIQALNPQGQALLDLLESPFLESPHLASLETGPNFFHGSIVPRPEFFTEEERSRVPSIFSAIRTLLEVFACHENAADHFGLYGAFGYDLIHQFEDIQKKLPRDDKQVDCHLFLPLSLVVVDRKKEIATHKEFSVVTPKGETALLPGGGSSFAYPSARGNAEIECDHELGEFAQKVNKVVEGTKRGDYFEVVLSQQFSTRADAKPTELFRRVSEINPSPYLFLLNFGHEQLLGSSPEIYARVSGRRFETCPIAGTVRRGKSALEDAAQVKTLILSQKDESELTMCTDVDRNDMARVCVPGSVNIIGRRQLEFYSHLIHTVDHIEGTLSEGLDSLDAFQTHMWACTVTGAPKPAALQEIENLENSSRGWYSGAVGFFLFNGDTNSGITLRSAVLRDGRAHVRAGATLLFGSDPQAEEQETRTKAAALLSCIGQLREEGKNPNRSAKTQASLIERIGGLPPARRVLLVDYMDSFVHNLASYLRILGAEVVTVRHNFPRELLDKEQFDLVILSPGPGCPQEFNISSLLGELVARRLPVFGVCLGHQAIGEFFGAKLGVLDIPHHGKSVIAEHGQSPLFEGIDEFFEAGRYHSLYVKEESLPDCLRVTAWAPSPEEAGCKRVVMALEHKTLPICGVQFHPESLLTLKDEAGHKILANVLANCSSISMSCP